MSKRTIAVLAALGLMATGLIGGAAQAAPEVPGDDDANIIDPLGDANFINPQGFGDLEGVVPRNVVLPASPSTVGDLLKVWFTNDADTISAHIQTRAKGPAATAIGYDVFASPGEGPVAANAFGCLRFFAAIPGSAPGGGNFQSEPLIKLLDRCNEGANAYENGIEGEFEWSDGPDGTGILSLTFPRSYSPLLEDGQALTAPKSRSALICCGDTPAARSAIALVFMDDTDPEIGKDYEIVGGGNIEEAPPPKVEKPKAPKRQNCKKIKNKKKRQACIKRQKKLRNQGCSAYVPGELGAEAETTVVTDAATEEEPIEVTLDTEAGLGFSSSDPGGDDVPHVFHNIQLKDVDGEAGLYVRAEFAAYQDYDLFVRQADGAAVAYAAGFNQAPVPAFGIDGTGHGGHSEIGAEQVDGVRSANCNGYTIDVASAITEGGDVTLKVWLGEIQHDPEGSALVRAVLALF